MNYGDTTGPFDVMRRAMELQRSRQVVDSDLERLGDMMRKLYDEFPDYALSYGRARNAEHKAEILVARDHVAVMVHIAFAGLFGAATPMALLRSQIKDACVDVDHRLAQSKADELSQRPVAQTHSHQVLGPDGWVDMTVGDVARSETY